MWVERLNISGFKAIAGRFEFDAGLTLVIGPNEAGKSSLAEAFIRSIWGFEVGDRRRRPDGSAWERCRPWSGGEWTLQATLVDHDGRRMRAEWDFAQPRLRLLDALTGDDLTATVAGRRNDYALGARLTGVTATDFRDVCRFDQQTLAAVKRSDSLVNALQRAVESADSEVGVDEADERLRDYLRDVIGARSDNYASTAGGKLRRDEEAQRRCREQLEAAETAQADIVQLAQTLRRRALQVDVLTAERDELTRAVLGDEAREARTLHEQARDQSALAAAVPAAGPPDLDEAAVAAIERRFGALEQADSAIAQLTGQARSAAPGIAVLERDEQAAAAAVNRLAPFAELDTSRVDDVRERQHALHVLEAEPALEIPPDVERDPKLERFRARRDELLSLDGAAELRWDRTRLIIAAVIAVLSLVAVAVLGLAALAGLGIAAAVVATARTLTARDGLADRLRADFDGESLGALERRTRAEDAAVTRAEAAAESARAANAALERRIEDARAALAGLTDAPAEYLERCERKAEWERETAQLEALRRQLAEARTPERDVAEREGERETLMGALESALVALGIDPTDLAAARAELARRSAAARQRAEERSGAAGAQRALDALLGGRSVAELEEAAERADAALAAHRAEFGELQPAEGELKVLRERLEAAKARLGEARQLAAGLTAQIGERERNLPNVPELRERIAALDAAIADRELARDAIRVAREALAEAARQAHRNFAPHLQRALRRTLPRFTDDRYREVAIADDLGLSVVAPETGRHVPADCLSLATQDQIYLVQRLEIAKLLIPATGPVPLLLDEPFAEFDERRERAALELVCEEANERQVLLFSKDPCLVERMAEVTGAAHVIELAGRSVTA